MVASSWYPEKSSEYGIQAPVKYTDRAQQQAQYKEPICQARRNSSVTCNFQMRTCISNPGSGHQESLNL